MSTDLLLLDADIDPREAFNRLDDAHRQLAPVVDADGRLVGILTRKGALRATLYTPAVDADGPAAHRRRRRHQRRRGGQGRSSCSTRASTRWSSTPRTATRSR